MEISVRYIQVPDSGFKPAVVFRYEHLAQAIINDETEIRVLDLSLRDADQARVVLYAGSNYPVERAVSILKRTGKPFDYLAEQLLRVADGVLDSAIVAVKAPESTPEVSNSSALGRVCAALGLNPGVARRLLRKAGLRAPYTDETLIRKTLQESS